MAKRIAVLRKRIAVAVARARALGYELVAGGSWGTEYDKQAGWVPTGSKREVCICGAIALTENPSNGQGILRAIAKKYRITTVQAASLSDGFENHPAETGYPEAGYPQNYAHDKTWYRIGRKWRERADRVDN